MVSNLDMTSQIIKKKKLKEIIQKEGFRITKEAIASIEKVIEKELQKILAKAVRNAVTSGRKTIKIEDISS